MNSVCIIPARAGSKRLSDKNLQTVGGLPLLQRAINTARSACGSVYVSTDSPVYADLARGWGANVPSLRPAELAGDDTPTDVVVAHALASWAPEAELVAVVQATTPFTTPETIQRALRRAGEEPRPETVVSAVPAASTTAFVLREADGLAWFAIPDLSSSRTQDLPTLAIPDGGVYVAPAGRVRSGGPLVMEPLAWVLVDPSRSVDIDDRDDLERARTMTTGEP